jgi:hypothetical protein
MSAPQVGSKCLSVQFRGLRYPISFRNRWFRRDHEGSGTNTCRSSEIRTALEKAGVEFIPEDDLKGPGVRLKESTRAKARGRRKSSG